MAAAAAGMPPMAGIITCWPVGHTNTRSRYVLLYFVYCDILNMCCSTLYLQSCVPITEVEADGCAQASTFSYPNENVKVLHRLGKARTQACIRLLWQINQRENGENP